MNLLEDYIKNHKDDFDVELPSNDLWDAIESKIDPKPARKFRLWQIAASVAAIFIIGLIGTVLMQNGVEQNNNIANSNDPAVQELSETEAFYTGKITMKMAEIEKCYKIYPELKMEIEDEMKELDDMYDVLKKDLRQNMYNREVIEAMIQNNRQRLEVVDRVLKQINC